MMLFDIGIVDRQSAFDILQPHFQTIIRCIEDSWSDYLYILEVASDQALAFDATTRAKIIHDNMKKHAASLFRNKNGIICYSEGGIFTVDFFDKIRLRFKKLDDSLQPNNIETCQQQEFASQTLYGPSSTKVTAGYRLDKTQLSIRDIQIVCWFNQNLLWNIKLANDVIQRKTEEILISIPETRVLAKVNTNERTIKKVN